VLRDRTALAHLHRSVGVFEFLAARAAVRRGIGRACAISAHISVVAGPAQRRGVARMLEAEIGPNGLAETSLYRRRPRIGRARMNPDVVESVLESRMLPQDSSNFVGASLTCTLRPLPTRI
jgi:hypothetical protein